jgi:hypothetical protein
MQISMRLLHSSGSATTASAGFSCATAAVGRSSSQDMLLLTYIYVRVLTMILLYFVIKYGSTLRTYKDLLDFLCRGGVGFDPEFVSLASWPFGAELYMA